MTSPANVSPEAGSRVKPLVPLYCSTGRGRDADLSLRESSDDGRVALGFLVLATATVRIWGACLAVAIRGGLTLSPSSTIATGLGSIP